MAVDVVSEQLGSARTARWGAAKVDNPFRRGAPPWYGGRAARWVLGFAIAALLAANAWAFLELGRRTNPVTVGQALSRFRATEATAPARPPAAPVASTTPTTGPLAADPTAPAAAGTADPAAPEPEAAAGPQVAAPTAGESSAEPLGAPTPNGVYVYDTAGYESITALGGATHTYPAQSTMTVRSSACGSDVRWEPLEQRFDDWQLCRSGTGLALTSFTTHHEFFGQADERTFTCTGLWFRPPSDVPGTTTQGTCTTKGSQVAATTTVRGVEDMVVGGQAVKAVRVRVDEQLTGSTAGTRTSESWYEQTTGLLLKRTSSTDADTDSTLGQTRFREDVTLTLTSLDPLR